MAQIDEPTNAHGGWWIQAGSMTQTVVFLVIIAAAWFMLKELAALLRPLLMAILFCYALLPLHSRLRRDRSEIMTIVIMACVAMAATIASDFSVYGKSGVDER